MQPNMILYSSGFKSYLKRAIVRAGFWKKLYCSTAWSCLLRYIAALDGRNKLNGTSVIPSCASQTNAPLMFLHDLLGEHWPTILCTDNKERLARLQSNWKPPFAHKQLPRSLFEANVTWFSHMPQGSRTRDQSNNNAHAWRRPNTFFDQVQVMARWESFSLLFAGNCRGVEIHLSLIQSQSPKTFSLAPRHPRMPSSPFSFLAYSKRTFKGHFSLSVQRRLVYSGRNENAAGTGILHR